MQMSNNGLFNPFLGSDEEPLGNCQACIAYGQPPPAVGRSTHPDYRRVDLCAECLAVYNSANPESAGSL